MTREIVNFALFLLNSLSGFRMKLASYPPIVFWPKTYLYMFLFALSSLKAFSTSSSMFSISTLLNLGAHGSCTLSMVCENSSLPLKIKTKAFWCEFCQAMSKQWCNCPWFYLYSTHRTGNRPNSPTLAIIHLHIACAPLYWFGWILLIY